MTPEENTASFIFARFRMPKWDAEVGLAFALFRRLMKANAATYGI